MESPFARYSGQGIQPVTGMAEAGANIGQMYGNAIANFGKSISEGLQRYQENSAKNEILSQEAIALGDQIMAFQNQFRDPKTGQLNPEYAPFAQSLQPHIDKLSKVPSMSLTQKMGVVTGVKAAFANIAPQLQAFEMMRNVRLQQDFSKAQAGVKEFDTVSVPTAVIPEGKMPYYYNKSYQENEAAFTDLAKQAIAGGAKIDLNEAIEKWRTQIKGGAMANNNLPPEIKEGLIKQIDAAKGVSSRAALVEKANKEGRGLTEEEAKQFAGETVLGDYQRTTTSVKGQLEAKANPPQPKMGWNDDRTMFTTKMGDNIVTLDRAGKAVSSTPIPKPEPAARDNDVTMAKTELVGIEEEIQNLQSAIDAGEVPNPDKIEQFRRNIQSLPIAVRDKLLAEGTEAVARLVPKNTKITPEVAKTIADKMIMPEGFSETLQAYASTWGAVAGRTVANSPLGFISSMLGSDKLNKLGGRDLTENEINNLRSAIADKELESKLGGKGGVKTAKEQIDILNQRKAQLETTIETGIKNPTLAQKAEIQAKQAQQAAAKPELPEQLAVSNLGAFSLGSRQEQVATTLESKRKDLTNFFMEKYGYVPAGFEQSFKAMYPEAQFKTMETPYGAFMYDGKEWKQIATPTPAKPRSPKEIGEEKSYVFGIQKADGSQDFKEFYPNSGVYMRGIFEGSEKEKQDFRTQMLANARAKKVVGRLIEINDMMGESMPWNAALQGEAEGLLPQIMAALRPEIVGVGTVSNYEQQMIRDVVADPTKFFSLEAKDRAKLLVIATRIDNALLDVPAVYGLEVKMSGQTNAQKEMLLRQQLMGKGKTSREEEYNKTGKINWNR